MLHEINQPLKCVQDGLVALTKLAIYTIAFAVEHEASDIPLDLHGAAPHAKLVTALDQQMLERLGGAPFLSAVGTRFKSYITELAHEPAAEWLWNRYVMIAAPVVKLLALSSEEKQGIIEAFWHDVKLENRFEEGYFYFSKLQVSKDALKLVDQIMGNFYAKLLRDKGVPLEVLDFGLPVEDPEEGEAAADSLPNILEAAGVLNRDLVLRAYKLANEGHLVCPGCDESLACNIEDEDADHFFSQSGYPFLTVHPQNLTPYCKVCNQIYKHAEDILNKGAISLHHIYHPYFRTARDDLVVHIRTNVQTQKPEIHLGLKEPGLEQEARMSSLIRVFKLNTRWQDLLDDTIMCRLPDHAHSNRIDASSLDGIVIEILRIVSSSSRGNGTFELRDEWLLEQFNIMANEFETSIGSLPRRWPAKAYVCWLHNDQAARQKWQRFAGLALTTTVQHDPRQRRLATMRARALDW